MRTDSSAVEAKAMISFFDEKSDTKRRKAGI